TSHPNCRNESDTASLSADGMLFMAGDWNACGDGYLTARRASDGGIAWVRGTRADGYSPHPRQRPPAVDDATGAVYFGSSYLFAVDQATGGLLWKQSGGYYIGGQGIAIDDDGGVTYGSVTSSGGWIRSYSAAGGAQWSQRFSSATWDRARVKAVLDGNVLLVYHWLGDALLAIDADSGAGLWSAPGLEAAVADEAGNIYAAATQATELVKLDATGAEVWRAMFPTTDPTKRALLDFVDESGRVYVRVEDTLYAVDAETGAVAWSHQAAAQLTVPARLVGGGRLFLVDAAGDFTVFDTALDYAHSAWPISEVGNRRNTRKTGDAIGLPGGAGPPPPPPTDCDADADGDGVPDGWDDCPGSALGVATTADGCEAGPPLCYSAEAVMEAEAVARDAGHAEGLSEGYDLGYSGGIIEGRDIGYTEGYSAGYDDGHDIGFTEGYSEGYGDGSDDGIDMGKAICLADPASCGITVVPGHGGVPPGHGGNPPGKAKK
ncbi:MAG: outer membrane protein assembly factor BamB, partial [Myxococcota bacterium]